MRSFALWCSNKNGKLNPNKKAEVHINLWNKEDHDRKNYCFDFGFLIEDIDSIENLYLYVPFKVKKNDISDLGGIISNNKLSNAIFNENFTTTDGEPKRLIVNGDKEKSKFIIYSLEVESQIDIKQCARSGNTSVPGTILKIKVGEISVKPEEILKYYFRIRIKINSADIELINDEIKGVSIFSNQFTNTEVIDFRLNDVRSCSEELREQFDKGQKLEIVAVHYLILRSANDEIIHYGKEINSRMLERDLWSDYIDGTSHNIIAYHIKSKAKKVYDSKKDLCEYEEYIDDFCDLTRFQYQKDTRWIIIKYIIGIIVLGAIGGVIGNIISKLIDI